MPSNPREPFVDGPLLDARDDRNQMEAETDTHAVRKEFGSDYRGLLSTQPAREPHLDRFPGPLFPPDFEDRAVSRLPGTESLTIRGGPSPGSAAATVPPKNRTLRRALFPQLP